MREFKYDLFFVGTNYQLNADGINFFIEQIIQKILAQKPDLRLLIAGKVAELIQVDKALEQNVICMGYVPDLTELYLQSRVVICPLLGGSGTKVKLLEAIAYAMPIVTTTTGASGLSLKDGINAFITDDPELYAQRVLNLLKEPKLAQKVSEEVAMTFESEYSRSAVYSKLDAMLGI
jgi:glycosyltransferase involved in cell wall biosynthesis